MDKTSLRKTITRQRTCFKKWTEFVANILVLFLNTPITQCSMMWAPTCASTALRQSSSKYTSTSTARYVQYENNKKNKRNAARAKCHSHALARHGQSPKIFRLYMVVPITHCSMMWAPTCASTALKQSSSR